MGETPFHFAAKSGNLEVVKYLVDEKGADVNATSNVSISTDFHMSFVILIRKWSNIVTVRFKC